MAEFSDGSVCAALDRSIAAAEHLTDRDAAAVAAARALARKIDAWDQIVAWALEDVQDVKGGRPAVPANDNVSIASFLKYLDQLRLIPPAVAPSGQHAPATPKNEIDEMRKKLGRR